MRNFNKLLKSFTGVLTLVILQITSLSAAEFIVKYERIEADQFGEEVSVRWLTVSEFNNDFFTVQRSLDGAQTWEDLGEIASIGSVPGAGTYEYIDQNPVAGTIYYRIKQTDFDGTYTYSHDVSIFVEFFDSDEEEEIEVYPNPSDEFVIIETSTSFSGLVDVTLTDISGKKIAINMNVDNQKIRIQPIKKLFGLYFVILSDQQKTRVKKIKFK